MTRYRGGMMATSSTRTALAALVAFAATLAPAHAEELRNGGKLLLTGGLTTVDGAAGGGMSTLALIGGNETDAGIGGSINATYVPLNDFSITGFGAKVGLFDRVELSYQRVRFDTHDAGAALGLGQGYAFSQDVFGAKLRLFGDAVYDQHRVLPQVSIGVQHKNANRGAVIAAVGGRDDSGTDFYVSATKLILDKSLLLGGTLRLTKANQWGLLGHGGDRQVSATVQFEGTAGVMLSRKLIVGGEYRSKPNNLGFAKEQDAFDLFAAYAVNRTFAITAAYVDLGDIATFRNQKGLFLSLQAGF